MGLVYLCHDQITGCDIAVKTIKDEYLINRVARELFLDEAAKWILLGKHPNIVYAERLERALSTRQPCLILDWVKPPQGYSDASLSIIMNQRGYRPLPFMKTLGLILAIVRGMKHANDCITGLVHADLKPANILIDTDWRPRITDFGIARVRRIIAESSTSTFSNGLSLNNITGTPGYCAPEQLTRNRAIDQRADIFSVGVILYQLLTGIPLMRGTDAASIRKANISGDFRKIPVELPQGIQDLIRKCISIDPDGRYHDWQALEQAISACYLDVAGSAPPAPETTPTSKVTNRARRIHAHLEISKSFYDMGNYAKSLSHLKLAQEGAEKADDKLILSTVMHQLGATYLGLGKVHQADDTLRESLAIAKQLSNTLAEFDALSTLGAVCSQQGRNEEAIDLLRQALDIAHESGDRQAVATALGNLGSTLGQSGDPARAKQCFRDLLELSIVSGDQILQARTLASLGVANYDLKDYEVAIDHLSQALTLCERLGDDPGRLHVQEHLCKCFAALGQTQKAEYHCQEYQELAHLLRK